MMDFVYISAKVDYAIWGPMWTCWQRAGGDLGCPGC